MKKCLLIGTALLLLGSVSAMAESVVDSYAKPGDLSAQGGVGLTFYGLGGIGFSLLPGAELGLAQIKLTDQFPINFGVSGRGYFSSYSYSIGSYSFGYTYLGLGAYGTAHYSLKNLRIGEFFNHVDYYVGVGLGLTIATPTGTYADYYKTTYGTAYTEGFGSGIGVVGYSGASYYLNDRLALFVEYGSFAYYGGTVFGASYRF